jgi:hypothetical protein
MVRGQISKWRQLIMSNTFYRKRLNLVFVLAGAALFLGFISPRLSAAPSGLFESRKDFFEEITGVSEEEFRGYSSSLQKKFYKNKIKSNAGIYKEYTINELLKKTKHKKPFGGKGFFKVLYNKFVQEIFADSAFDGAAIQSASDMTGLEGGIVYEQELLNNMQDRAEQGETVAACTLYGNIERKYFKKKINLLDSIPGFKVKGENVVEIPGQLNESDFLNFKIGYQKNTRVTYEADAGLKTSKGFPALTKKKDDMYVDQAISFSMSLHSDYTKKLIKTHGKKHVSAIAKQIIKETYRGTILAACASGRQKVVLTLVGAGVYGNPVEWALEAIENMMPFIDEKNMQVYLDVLGDKLKPKIDLLVKKFKKKKVTPKKGDNTSNHDVKRVEVALYTRHPWATNSIFFTSSSRVPHSCHDGQGYFCCFPGTKRNSEESWEYNAARGFNEKTFYFFARKFDENEELFYNRLYHRNTKVREKYQRKANEIVAKQLKKSSFEQVNRFSRLYFLHMPYEDFCKEIRSKRVHDQRLELIGRFGKDRVIATDSIRPGKYFNWIDLPECRAENAKQAFNGKRLRFSPFSIPLASGCDFRSSF